MSPTELKRCVSRTRLLINPQPGFFLRSQTADSVVNVSEPIGATVDFGPPAGWSFDADQIVHMARHSDGYNLDLRKVLLIALDEDHSWLLETATQQGLIAPLGVGVRGLGAILKASALPVLLVVLHGHASAGGTLEIDAKLPSGATKRLTIVVDNEGRPKRF